MAKIQPPAPPYLGPVAHSSGTDNKPIGRIVIHCTVSKCAVGARDIAAYFKKKTAGGSAHYVTDAAETIQSAYDSVVAWHAPPNAHSLGVEMCCTLADQGKGHWERADHIAMMKRTAALVAQLCLAYDVPIKKLSPADLRAGKHGICGHVDVSQAFKQSSHWDPGPHFPWDKFMGMVRAAAADLTKPPAKPATKPTKKPQPKAVKVIGNLTIAHGNLFKDNAHKATDVALLDTQTAHVFGLNEAYRFRDLLKTLKNYRVVAPGTGAALNNVILLRHDVTWLGEGTRKMCDKVGTSPERTATWALYEHAGHKWAHIQTHTNAHIEDGGKPRNLPRVTQDIRHLANLTGLVKELRVQGYRVTVAGDFNWAYRVGKVWANAPRVVFWRLGMWTNWQNTKTAPAGGSLGSRRIDYLAHSAADLRIAGQHIISGEHSDHRWLSVTYRVVA